MAMCGGSTTAPFDMMAWPTAEFAAMGLEGAVRLGFKDKLAAVQDDAARAALFETIVAAMRERGAATNAASLLELDAVLDPAHTRARLARGLKAYGPVKRAAERSAARR